MPFSSLTAVTCLIPAPWLALCPRVNFVALLVIALAIFINVSAFGMFMSVPLRHIRDAFGVVSPVARGIVASTLLLRCLTALLLARSLTTKAAAPF